MKIFLLFILSSGLSFAQVSKVDIKNFNFNYEAPLGEGVADNFSYQKEMNNQQKVNVEKFSDFFKIKLEGVENQEMEFKNAPAFIQEAEKINLNTFNFDLGEKISLGLVQGSFISSQDEFNLKNVNLFCERSAASELILDQALMGCIQKMTFKVSGFSSMPQKGIDYAMMEALNSALDTNGTALSLKNVDLKINAGKFQLGADIKAQISGTALANGTVKYEPTEKKIIVKVSEVKFGFLDLTSKVFEELKKQESDTIKINKPYITILIK